MITLRRAGERSLNRSRNHEIWRTFHAADPADSLVHGFGNLELLDEVHLLGGGRVPRHPWHDAEVITYVCEGAIAYQDSTGRSGVICAGEFHHMSCVRGTRHSEANASRTGEARFFQAWLRPCRARDEVAHEQQRFSTAERRRGLCLVAAPDSRQGSLQVHQNVLMFSSLIDPGQHVVHALPEGRAAWLHLVVGTVLLGDLVLTAGDGVGVTGEHAVSFIAQEATELLLFDLGPGNPG